MYEYSRFIPKSRYDIPNLHRGSNIWWDSLKQKASLVNLMFHRTSLFVDLIAQAVLFIKYWRLRSNRSTEKTEDIWKKRNTFLTKSFVKCIYTPERIECNFSYLVEEISFSIEIMKMGIWYTDKKNYISITLGYQKIRWRSWKVLQKKSFTISSSVKF